MRSSATALLSIAALAGLAISSGASADDTLDAQIAALAHDWDHAEFELADKGAKMAAFDALATRAQMLEDDNPSAAEPMVWEAIVLSSEAGVQRSLGALGKARRARDLLEAAAEIDPNALGDASIYTSLGSLYYQVPGRPVGFGNHRKARGYLEHALELNPDGLEPNYFMADFLVHEHEYVDALSFAERAQEAPSRPGRAVADAGRRRETDALMTEIQEHLDD